MRRVVLRASASEDGKLHSELTDRSVVAPNSRTALI